MLTVFGELFPESVVIPLELLAPQYLHRSTISFHSSLSPSSRIDYLSIPTLLSGRCLEICHQSLLTHAASTELWGKSLQADNSKTFRLIHIGMFILLLVFNSTGWPHSSVVTNFSKRLCNLWAEKTKTFSNEAAAKDSSIYSLTAGYLLLTVFFCSS